MREEAKRPRRLWLWLTVGVVAAAALVATGVALGQRPVSTPTATPSGVPSSSSSPPTADGEPTGCLGGASRDAKMVLAARSTAPHTSNGAIEVGTAFVRWLNQYPYPTAADVAAVQGSALSATSPTKDIAAFFATKPNLSGGLVPDGSPYFLSTVPGVYNLESAAPDVVTASIGTGLVVDGALSPTLKGSITVTMKWEDGGWKFVSTKGTRTTQELYSIGRPFTAGC